MTDENRLYCSPDNPDEDFGHWMHFSPPHPEMSEPMPISPNGMCPVCGVELIVLGEGDIFHMFDGTGVQFTQFCPACGYESEPYYDL